ncbi:MAG TPA: 50S ribosomal protein L20 [Chlamydiales bacterium]|nr:50S ribosomal protein L20 [Chlamydiales bacterium]
MVRATNAVASLRRKKRVFKKAKGFWGDRKNHLRLSMDAVMRACASNYIHRKLKKRDFRGLWIQRLGIASKMNGISYSKLVAGLKQAGCLLNRKVLSEMAIRDPQGFASVVSHAKKALV